MSEKEDYAMDNVSDGPDGPYTERRRKGSKDSEGKAGMCGDSPKECFMSNLMLLLLLAGIILGIVMGR